jgi:hypothetical protein
MKTSFDFEHIDNVMDVRRATFNIDTGKMSKSKKSKYKLLVDSNQRIHLIRAI